jgi:hypothetical protein
MGGMVKRRTAAAAAAVAVLALAGCGDDGDEPGDAAPTTETTAGTDDGPGETEGPEPLELEPETTTTTTPEDAALGELLIGEAPEGFAPDLDRPLDLDAATEAEPDAEAERALLETRSFERGYARTWVNQGQEVVYAAVYDFGTAQDAALYLEDGTQTLTARGASTFEVPDVEGARGFTTIEESEAGSFTAHAVAFTRDDKWFLLLAGSTGSGVTPDDARQLALAQAERLGAAGAGG